MDILALTFSFKGRFTDKPPHLVELPKAPKSKCDCAFCLLVFQMGLRELTETDIATFRAHLRKHHGLKEEISA